MDAYTRMVHSKNFFPFFFHKHTMYCCFAKNFFFRKSLVKVIDATVGYEVSVFTLLKLVYLQFNNTQSLSISFKFF